MALTHAYDRKQAATGRAVREYFDTEPKVAMLSFSNFGSVDHEQSRRSAEAVRLAKELDPTLVIDGEMAVKFLRRVCELLERPELLWFYA